MRISVYIEAKKLMPPVEDLLRAVIAQYPVITELELWNQYTSDRTVPVLVLGAMPDVLPITLVRTLSQRQLLATPSALTELSSAINQLLKPVKLPPMQYKLIGSFENAQRYLDRMGDTLVVDIETGGDIDVMLPSEQWLLSLAINDGKNILVFPEEWLASKYNQRVLSRFLLDPKKRLIAHNMKFDFAIISAQWGIDLFGHHCTLLMHHVLNPGAKEHGLKPLARKYLGAPDWDAATKKYATGKYKLNDDGIDPKVSIEKDYIYPRPLQEKYGKNVAVGFESIPRHILYRYNAEDVYWNWHLYKYMVKGAVGDPRIGKLARFEFEMSNFFQVVESNGMAVDHDYLAHLDGIFTEEKRVNDINMHEIVKRVRGEDAAVLNPNSPPQVKAMYADLGYPLRSTGIAVLEELEFDEGDSEGAGFTEALLAARRVTKMHGTYVTGITKRTHSGLIHSDFLVHGTSTGRLSSRDPNVQNIPRDEDGKLSLRRIFVPRDLETRSMLSVDYAQAELRVMACLSMDKYLISLFQPGMPDFFDSLMPTAFPHHNLGDYDTSTLKNLRANLKGVIYGMSYGRRAAAIAKALGISVREAQLIITNYFNAAPELYQWRQWVEQTSISPEHTLISPFGRYYQSEVVSSRNKQNVINSGLAFLPQSTASDMCISAAMEVQKWVHTYDALIVATIHDAILLDCPDENLDAVAVGVQNEMEAAGRRVFGDTVPFETEATWGKSWQGI